jgi:Zn-dependent protease
LVTKEVKRTVKCQYCDKDVTLPFKCPFCNQQFCPEHRLPENHECPEYWRAKIPRQEPPPPIIIEGKPYEYTVTYTPKPMTRTFWFSPKEVRHLVIGTLLVAGVGLSYVLQIGPQPQILAGLTITFTLAFLLHELSHKIQAQRLGLWAEFRLTMFGALITLISIFLPVFKIISPGAVMISGPVSREIAGKTAIAGPLTNIVLSSALLFSFFYLPLPLSVIVIWGAAFNAWIALFNLVPFGMMDGLKVFWWNKIIWGIAFIISGALTVLTYAYLP